MNIVDGDRFFNQLRRNKTPACIRPHRRRPAEEATVEAVGRIFLSKPQSQQVYDRSTAVTAAGKQTDRHSTIRQATRAALRECSGAA